MRLYSTLLIDFFLCLCVLCENPSSSSTFPLSTITLVTSTEVEKKNEIGQNAVVNEEDSDDEEDETNVGKERPYSRETREDKGPKVWDRWSKWSKCSVTCGNGKQTRWRHCVNGSCMPGEKEAQIKTCVMHPC